MAKNKTTSVKNTAEMARLLTNVLSDVYVLAIKAHVYHWNVTGPQFPNLHAFFETQYKGLPEVADEIAERIRMMGPPVRGGMAEFLANSIVKEATTKPMQAKAMIKEYLQDMQKVRDRMSAAEEFADSIDDVVTEGLMAKLMGDFDKTIWMLKSQLA